MIPEADTLDLKSNQKIEMARISMEYSSLSVVCSAIGIKTMANNLQKLMDKLFSKLPFVSVYIDGISIYANTRNKHIENVKHVIEILTRYSLPIRVEIYIYLDNARGDLSGS